MHCFNHRGSFDFLLLRIRGQTARLEAVIDQIADRRRGQEDADAGPPDHLPRGGRGADDYEEAQELL